ncbi:MAG: T9SS type A sorting domain-containing protein [Prevotellaceae bacterium]|nr:T9SS type A sorting domain-containing protein [Prevotellaceae bacterium]
MNEGDTIPYQVKAGETVDLPVEPARNGYFFGGWYNGETEWNFNAAVNANLILTAKWTTGQTFVASGVLSGVALYPNPVSNAVTVTGLTGSETIELFSVSGALVLSRKASSDKAVIGAAGLSSGAYLVRITRGSASKQLKLIKN